MKMMFAALALVSIAAAASAEPGAGSAVGYDQDLMIVGRAPVGAAASDAAAVEPSRSADSAPSDTQRKASADRGDQADLPAA